MEEPFCCHKHGGLRGMEIASASCSGQVNVKRQKLRFFVLCRADELIACR